MIDGKIIVDMTTLFVANAKGKWCIFNTTRRKAVHVRECGTPLRIE